MTRDYWCAGCAQPIPPNTRPADRHNNGQGDQCRWTCWTSAEGE